MHFFLLSWLDSPRPFDRHRRVFVVVIIIAVVHTFHIYSQHACPSFCPFSLPISFSRCYCLLLVHGTPNSFCSMSPYFPFYILETIFILLLTSLFKFSLLFRFDIIRFERAIVCVCSPLITFCCCCCSC